MGGGTPQLTEEQRKQLEEKLKSMPPEELRQLQKQQCIFCQIISGKIPSKTVFHDEKCIAILDINPATRGHLLLIPKEHYAIMPQVPAEDLKHFFRIAKLLSQGQLRALKVSGTNLFIANGPVAGQRAQHFMIHLLPRKEGDHLLNLPEKLVEQKLLQDVKAAIQDRLIQLIGSSATLTAAPEEVNEENSEKMEPTPRKKKAIPAERKQRKQKIVKQQKEEPTEEQGKETSETEEEKKDGSVSIDEIADLFK